MSDGLPEGWTSAKIGMLFDCWGGMTPSTGTAAYWGGSMPWVSSKDVKGAVVDGGTESVTRRALDETRLRRCRPGTVLVVVRSGVLAHTLPVAITSREVVVNQDVKALDSGDDDLNAWLAAYLRAEQRMILEENRKDGTTVQSIRVEQLLDRELPLPPLAEQKRIVRKVEALLADVNRTRDRLANVPQILKRFRQSVLAAACSGRLTDAPVSEDPDRDWVPISELVVPGGLFDGARDHGSGTRVEMNLRTVDYTSTGMRVVRLENLGHLSFNDEKRTYISPQKFAGLRQSAVFPGDVMFSSFIGEPMRVCVLPTLDAPALAKADCFCVRVDSKKINPMYVAMQLACRRTHDSILGQVHGATRARITTRQLAAIRIPICTLAAQAEMVGKAAGLFAIAEAVEARAAIAEAAVLGIPRAVLAQAFSGGLVPTEAEVARREARGYESARELLTRLAIEHEPAESGTQRRRRVNAKRVSRSRGSAPR